MKHTENVKVNELDMGKQQALCNAYKVCRVKPCRVNFCVAKPIAFAANRNTIKTFRRCFCMVRL